MDFAQLFNNPYLANLPPEVQAQLQQRQAMDLGMSLLANSGGQKDGLAAFGDAMRQYRTGQAGQGQQMMEMQKLAETMRLAKEKGVREQSAFQGGGFTAQHKRNQLTEQQRQANMQNKTTLRGQDVRAQTARDIAAARNNLFGAFPGGPGGPTQPQPSSPAEAAKMRFNQAKENAPPNPGPQQQAAPAAAAATPEGPRGPASPRAVRAAQASNARERQMREMASGIASMTSEELDKFEEEYGEYIDVLTDTRIKARRATLGGARPLSRR